MHVYIEDIGRHDGEEVTIRGWLHNRRSSGKIHFLILRDGSGFIQAVMSRAAVGEDMFRAADHLSQETSVIVTGTVRADKRAPGGYEIDVKGLEIVGVSHDYPITPKEHGVDYLLDRRHLWIRSERQQAILRIRHEVINAVRDFFNSRGFILTDTPIFTPAACEGTSTLFPVEYFEDQKVYLTQSGQLYLESTAMALGRVYSFGPTFRAEKSKTRRHLTEFWMVEPEVAYAGLEDMMDLAEDLVVSIVARVLDRRARELSTIERDTSKLATVVRPFPRITYDEAVQTLQAKGLPIQWGGDFGGPDETTLSEQYRSPGPGAPLSVSGEGLLHETGRRTARARAGGGHAGARRVRGDHRRRRAPGGSRPAAAAYQGAQSAAGGVRVVPRPAPVRHRAARRFRDGHRARGLVDLQARTRPRDDSVSANDVSDVSLKPEADRVCTK